MIKSSCRREEKRAASREAEKYRKKHNTHSRCRIYDNGSCTFDHHQPSHNNKRDWAKKKAQAIYESSCCIYLDLEN